MYTPNNACTYAKAFSGCLAGLGGGGKYLDATAGDESAYAKMADTYAQEFDTVWGAIAPTAIEEDAIFAVSFAVWRTRSPLESQIAFTAGAYNGIVRGAIALVQEGNAQVVSEGIDPNGCTGPVAPTPPILTTGNFAMPAVGTTAVAPISSTTQFQTGAPNNWAYFVNGGWLEVTAVAAGVSITVRNWGNSGNVATGAIVPVGSLVVPTGDLRDTELYDIRRFGATTANIGPSILAAGLVLQANGWGVIYVPVRLDGNFWRWTSSAMLSWSAIGTGTVPGSFELRGDSTPIQFEEGALGFPALNIVDATNTSPSIVRAITLLGDPANGDDCPRAISIVGATAEYDHVNGFGIQARDGFGIFEAVVSDNARFQDCQFAGCHRINEGGVVAVTGGGATFDNTRFSSAKIYNGVTYSKGSPNAWVYVRVNTNPIAFNSCIFEDNTFTVAQVWYKVVTGNAVNKLTFRDSSLFVSASVGATGPPCVLIEGPPGAQADTAGVDFLSCSLSDSGGHREILQPQPIIQYTACSEVSIRNCFVWSSLQLNPANTDPNLFPAKGIIPMDSIGTVHFENNSGLYLHPYFVNGAPILLITGSGVTTVYPAHGSNAFYDCNEALTINTGATITGAGATYAPVVPGHTLHLLYTPLGPVTIVFSGAENSQATFLATINAQLPGPFATAVNNGGQTEIILTGNLQMYGASSGQVLASSSADVLTSLGLTAIPFPVQPRVISIGDNSGNGNLLQGFVANAATLQNPDPSFNNFATLQFRNTDALANFGAFAAIPQPFTLVIVGRQRVAATAYAVDGSAANQCGVFGVAGENAIHVNAGTDTTWPVNDTTKPHVYIIEVNGTNTTVSVDSAAAQPAQNAGANALAGITLGQQGGGAGATALAGWDLAMVKVIAGTFSDQQREELLAYASSRWGTTQETTGVSIAADVLTPAFSQLPTASATGANMRYRPQPSTAGGGVNGNFDVDLAAPPGGGGKWGWFRVVNDAGQVICRIGPDANDPTVTNAFWLLPTGVAPDADDWLFKCDGTNVRLQSPAVGGRLLFQFGNVVSSVMYDNSGGSNSVNFFGTASDYGAGVKIIRVGDTTSPPTSNPAGASLYFGTAGAAMIRSSNGVIGTTNPTGEGTQQSQAGTLGNQHLFYLETAASGATATADIPIATNTNKNFRLIISGRIAAGSTTGTVGDAWGATREAMFKNVAGVVSQVGATTVVSTFTDANMATSSVALSVSGTNARVTITAPTGEGATPTIDWEVLVIALDD